MAAIKLSAIREKARDLGIELVGGLQLGSTIDPPLNPAIEKFEQWQAAGFGGEMKYLLRKPETYFSPALLLPGAEVVLSFFVPYGDEKNAALNPLCGRVAKYAWEEDYHLILPALLTKLMNALLPKASADEYRIFTDAVPLHERYFAAVGGVGFVGRNSLIITYQAGSFGFLAEVLAAFPVEFDLASLAHPRLAVLRGTIPGAGCGSCQSCTTACPTSAIVGDGVIDARMCISYLTIEKRGSFSEWESAAVGEWIFGCDVCQEVCPFNLANSHTRRLRETKRLELLSQLNLPEVLSIRTNAEFKARFERRPFLRAKREGLLRNAAAVAKNRRVIECLPQLIACVEEDTSPVVREEALRTLRDFSRVATGLDLMRINNALSLGSVAHDD